MKINIQLIAVSTKYITFKVAFAYDAVSKNIQSLNFDLARIINKGLENNYPAFPKISCL